MLNTQRCLEMIDWSIHFWDFYVITRFAPKSKHILPAVLCCHVEDSQANYQLPALGGHALGDVFFPWDTANKCQVSTENNERWHRLYMLSKIAILNGGNSTILEIFTRKLGRIPIIELIFFRWVGSTTNQWGGSWIASGRLSPKMVPRRWWWHPRRPEASGISCGGKTCFPGTGGPTWSPNWQ